MSRQAAKSAKKCKVFKTTNRMRPKYPEHHSMIQSANE